MARRRHAQRHPRGGGRRCQGTGTHHRRLLGVTAARHRSSAHLPHPRRTPSGGERRRSADLVLKVGVGGPCSFRPRSSSTGWRTSPQCSRCCCWTTLTRTTWQTLSARKPLPTTSCHSSRSSVLTRVMLTVRKRLGAPVRGRWGGWGALERRCAFRNPRRGMHMCCLLVRRCVLFSARRLPIYPPCSW